MEYSHEIIVPNDDLPFKMFIFEGSQGGYIRQKHWHRSIEIFAVFDGEMEFYLNDKRYPLHTGEFMLVNSNELHSIYAPKKNKTLVIQIPVATFERYYTDDGFIYFSHSSRMQNKSSRIFSTVERSRNQNGVLLSPNARIILDSRL